MMNPAGAPGERATGNDGAGPCEVAQPKLIYLARRHRALSRIAFVERWRRHGALGMSLPRWRNIARYVHCDVLDFPAPMPGLDFSYDAVGLIWHRSAAARAAHLADTSSREVMEQDERETFAEPIVDTCLVAREHVCVAPSAGGPSVAKLIRVFEPDLTTTSLEAESARLRAALQQAGITLRGHVVNLPLPPERGARWRLDVGRIDEAWFDDVATATRAAGALAALHGSLPCRTLLTNEVPLYTA